MSWWDDISKAVGIDGIVAATANAYEAVMDPSLIGNVLTGQSPAAAASPAAVQKATAPSTATAPLSAPATAKATGGSGTILLIVAGLVVAFLVLKG